MLNFLFSLFLIYFCSANDNQLRQELNFLKEKSQELTLHLPEEIVKEQEQQKMAAQLEAQWQEDSISLKASGRKKDEVTPKEENVELEFFSSPPSKRRVRSR